MQVIVSRMLTVVASFGLLLTLLSALAAPAGAAEDEAVTKKALKSAPVPSLCEHPAGTLVNGKLPGIAPDYGFVVLGPKRSIAKGKVQPSSAGDAAAVIHCSMGGNSFFHNVVVYGPGPTIIGKAALNGFVRKIWIKKRAVHLQIVGMYRGYDEPNCCRTKSAKFVLKWNKKKQRVVIASKKAFTERPTAKKVIAAVNAKKYRKARKYARPSAVGQLRIARKRGKLSLRGCVGVLHPDFGYFAYDEKVRRQCYVKNNRCGGYLGLQQRGWNGWKVRRAITWCS